ncbi:MAG: hotdog fold domain-containing protein [Pseudomarimonas sp.]
MAAVPNTLAQYRRLAKLPAGGWLFSRLVCWKAPYFGSIRPRVLTLEPDRCVIEIDHRRQVQNHIGTVHAIALCNLAEMVAGLCSEASLPVSMRWIPKGMEVEYLAKANGRMRAVGAPGVPAVHAEHGYELPIKVSVTDPAGVEVFRANIRMWATPRPQRS